MIVVAGEALIDLLLLEDGRLTATPGGGPYNTARTIARLGGPVTFLGGLSTDRFGRRLREGLECDGVWIDDAPGTDAPTTLAVAELDPTGAATYRFYTDGTSAVHAVPPVAALQGRTVADGTDGTERSVAAVHVGTLGLVLEPLAGSIEALVREAPGDAVVMLDVNARPTATPDRQAWADRVDRLLRRVDVVKVSSDDLAVLRPDLAAPAACADLLAGGATAVLWTDGSAIVRIVTARGTREIEPPRVTVVDTVGAGDAFGGGFLAHWIVSRRARADLASDDALSAATAHAARVAAMTCTRAGADPPTADELAAWVGGR